MDTAIATVFCYHSSHEYYYQYNQLDMILHLLEKILIQQAHISGLCLRMSNTSGPDGIRAFPPHQVFGLTMGPRPQQVLRNAGVTFLPSLELYLRNSLLTFDCLRTEVVLLKFPVRLASKGQSPF